MDSGATWWKTPVLDTHEGCETQKQSTQGARPYRIRRRCIRTTTEEEPRYGHSKRARGRSGAHGGSDVRSTTRRKYLTHRSSGGGRLDIVRRGRGGNGRLQGGGQGGRGCLLERDLRLRHDQRERCRRREDGHR